MRKYFLFILLLITSCNLPAPQPSQPTSSIQVENTKPSPISTTPAPTTPITPVHETYILNTVIDYDRHHITVNEIITYPNHTGQSLNSLTLAIAANLWPTCFNMNQITVDNTSVTDATINAHRLDIPLQTPLAPDSVSTIVLNYSLSLPYMDQANSLRARIFGYSDIQMNLVNWYPFIVPFKDGQWTIREPWSHGEYLVYPVADFEVNLTFTDPENAPIVAASGFAESNGESTKYTLTEGRAFAISASRDFQVSHIQVGDTTVYSYYFPIFKSAGEAAMIASAQALQIFAEKFGPYPHRTLSVVIADFKDSMEFSAFFFTAAAFTIYTMAPRLII